jgi:predicted PurR-regulated permease PerM
MSVRRLPTSPGDVVDKRAENRRQSNTRILSISIIVIAILYIARTVLVPIALAILFSFLLTPIVRLLERTFLRRTGAIVLSLGLTIAGLGFGAWWMYQQFSDVAREISQAAASGHIEEKLKFLRTRTGGTLAVFERTLQRVEDARAVPEKPDRPLRGSRAAG